MYSVREMYTGTFRAGKKRVARVIGKHFSETFERKLRNPVFIIGCGRSGTSMLTKLLRNHQDICSYSEANEIWDPEGYPWYRSQLDRSPIWYDAISYTNVWRQYFGDKYKKELKGIFGCYQYISKKKVFLNKSPMNTFRIPDILEIFPDAKFIHIIRDGRPVAYSWAKKQDIFIKKHENVYRKRGYYYTFDELINYMAKSWIEHVNEVNAQKKKLKLLNKGIILEFTYEDFCNNPEKFVNLSCKFLSLKREKLGINDLSHIKSKNYKWKKNLSEKSILKLNDILTPSLNEIYSI